MHVVLMTDERCNEGDETDGDRPSDGSERGGCGEVALC